MTDAFLTELRQLRDRSGRPSFRKLSSLAEQRIAAAPREEQPEPLPPSTISEVLAGKRSPRLPRWGFVEAYVVACLRADGADPAMVAAETARWRERWEALAVEELPEVPERRKQPSWRWAVAVLAVVFLLGVGTGVLGTVRWTGRTPAPVADPAQAATSDTCGAASRPAGKDLLLPGRGAATARGGWWVDDPGKATLRTRGRDFDVSVPGGTTRPADVLVIMSDVTLVAGHTYELAFTATADREATVRVRVQDSRPPDYLPSVSRDFRVGPAACRRAYRFPGAVSSPHSELTFQLGGQTDSFQLTVSDVVLVEARA
ncbi:hypothetical protein [Actinoplanes sp. NBRC 103695]|uniref:hypothetical protein n=1 Tax=Actinoplanes sp. NBRC 103695 TaxID=3032202 RepID=UPI002553FEB5|nr:hypothetical protein [Actinoplanes sp. NBRC 103695]